MADFRKYACEISGVLFKEINKKGIRRDRLAKELNISVNQIKNYAYDSTKSATLENFLHAMITHKCADTLSALASEMGYTIYKKPDGPAKQAHVSEAAADALFTVSKAVSACLDQNKRAAIIINFFIV